MASECLHCIICCAGMLHLKPDNEKVEIYWTSSRCKQYEFLGSLRPSSNSKPLWDSRGGKSRGGLCSQHTCLRRTSAKSGGEVLSDEVEGRTGLWSTLRIRRRDVEEHGVARTATSGPAERGSPAR